MDVAAVVVSDRDGLTANMEKQVKAHATATKKDFIIKVVKRVMLINVNRPIVQKLNDLIADDQKETAKKYLDILYNTALLESRYSVKNMHDYSMWIQSMLEREIKRIETADNDADNEHVDDPSMDEV